MKGWTKSQSQNHLIYHKPVRKKPSDMESWTSIYFHTTVFIVVDTIVSFPLNTSTYSLSLIVLIL